MPSAAAAGGAAAPATATQCSVVTQPYAVAATTLDPSFVPASVGNFWGGAGEPALRVMVTVSPTDQRVYAGITRKDAMGFSAVIAPENGTAADALVIPNVILGGLAATSDGLATLVYDPNTAVDMRMWAAVKRFGTDRMERWNTELFRSANLTDPNTKANPARGRLGYLPMSDELVAYFGHMEMLQGTRHQGGYVATLSPTGTQRVNSKWFGSHNLDQRLTIIDGARAAVFGLGDAYPRGFFYSFTERANPVVVYRVAASGDGASNGQVGSLVTLADAVVASFVTDKSLSQDLSAGEWPDIDATISMQIRTAATKGVDVGLLVLPKSGTVMQNVMPTWLNLEPAAGARIGTLKTVQYGKSDALLVAWSELSGTRSSASANYFAMVVDRNGGVCQPKQPLASDQAFTYDDLLVKSDGSIVWGNGVNNQVHVVTLTPRGG